MYICIMHYILVVPHLQHHSLQRHILFQLILSLELVHSVQYNISYNLHDQGIGTLQ